MNVLNIGGGFKGIQVPAHYADWEMVYLDIDPAVEPDIVLDARDLGTLDAECYDAVYASHLLEHFAPHDLGPMLQGVLHVLRHDGFAEFRVPDIWTAVQAIFRKGGDLYAPMYLAGAGIVTARDMLWGYARYVEVYGDHQAHHNGFTTDTLRDALTEAGFHAVYVGSRIYEIHAIASKTPIEEHRLAELGVVLGGNG